VLIGRAFILLITKVIDKKAIIRKDKKSFEIVFLSANNNYAKLVQQAKEFKVKNIFIKK